jgi:phosphonoacetate hydrolase
MILEKQRVVVGMIDGFGIDYYDQNALPVLKSMARDGLFNQVSAVYPTVTNTNNVSICCGAWPSDHGITGNSYFDEKNGTADYRCASLSDLTIERAAERECRPRSLRKNKPSACCRRDLHRLPRKMRPPITDRRKPAHIYSREINYWLWKLPLTCAVAKT